MKLTDDMGIAAAARLGVNLTHPEKIVFADQAITKAQVVAYYEAVAGRMLPHLVRRPLSLVRCPQGASGHCFFQKHDSGGFPDAFKAVTIETRESTDDQYLYVEDLAGIVGGVQMNTLEFHIWGSHVDHLEQPDRIIFDIDPDEGLDFRIVRRAAIDIRDRLAEWGLRSFPMVTGGKGVHVIAPLQPSIEWPMVKLFCRASADQLEANDPERFTSNIRKVERKGRMFVDYLRNERGSTAIAPFSTRARDKASCAVPIGWDEVETIKGANLFSLAEAAARARQPDPWPDYFELTQSITRGMVESVAGPLRDKF